MGRNNPLSHLNGVFSDEDRLVFFCSLLNLQDGKNVTLLVF